MNVLTITGWGQKLDSLDEFASRFGNVTNLPYIQHSTIDEVAEYVEGINKKFSTVIGWSLGAQIAVRLVEKKILSPKLLVLFSPPFQYVKDQDIKSGTHSMSLSLFRNGYSMFPGNTLRQFSSLVCQNDDHAMNIIETMDDDGKHHARWLKWLDELADYSCKNINFKDFPRTIVFHGDGDAVTHVDQGKLFCKAIENSKFILLENCGHAPHLHDPDIITDVIKQELS